MENFNDYKVAEISESERAQLTKLENSISSEKDKHIVLIAYEEKNRIS